MQNPLTERCFKSIHQKRLQGTPYQILHTVFIEKEFPAPFVLDLIDCLEKQVGLVKDLFFYCKEFISCLFFAKQSNKFFEEHKNRLVSLYESIKLHPEAFDSSLAQSYTDLIATLLDRPFQEVDLNLLPSGFITEGSKDIALLKERIVLQNQIEISLNLLMIALLRQDERLVEKASKIILAFANCLDDHGELLIGLWSSDVIADKNPFFALTFLTLYTFNQIAKLDILDNALKIQAGVILGLPDLEIDSIGSYAFILAFSLDQILNQNLHELKHEIRFSDQKSTVLEDVGLVVDKLGNFSTYLTLSGINHSIGSILAKDVQVIAMGPHFFPLGDLSKFGIFQSIDKEHFMPLQYERHDDKTLIKGMTKIIHADSNKSAIKPSDTWLQLEVANESNKLKLSVSLLGEPCKLPLSFAFFIKSSETEMIGNRQVKPKSLDKYIGPSQKVVFKGSNKNFSILPCFDEKMHLIPLQGKNHFWGADYLLACEISQFSKKYSWEFQ
jgi:hypothetical protein